jgi:hypothetical protein
MNTIQITNAEGMTVNYTEAEINNIMQAKETHKTLSETRGDIIRDVIYKVRDFFSEGEWEGNNFSATKDSVNELLESCDIRKLARTYSATLTITAYVNGVEAEDEDEARESIESELDVSLNIGDINVDYVDITEVETDD